MYRTLVVGVVAVIACATAGREGNGDGNGRVDGPGSQQLDANNCATQPCDIPSQCGCGTTGACDIDTSDNMGTACRVVTTAGTQGSACNGPEDCGRGDVCLGGSGDSTCHNYCANDADCVSPHGHCVIDITNGTSPLVGIPPACSASCDPSNNALGGCGIGRKCSVFDVTHAGSNLTIADCDAAGAGSQGASGSGTSCQAGATGDDALCAANHLCTTVDGAAPLHFYCRRICMYPGGACPGSKTCLRFNPHLVVDATEYGVCN